MIFTMDVGNTNIKTALFEGREMRNYWRISTNTSYTSDEYGLILEGLFARAGLSLDAVEGIVMSSVVPTINFTLEHMCKNYFGKMPMTVAPGIKTGINLRYENPRELGSDRIANAVGRAGGIRRAVHLYRLRHGDHVRRHRPLGGVRGRMYLSGPEADQ